MDTPLHFIIVDDDKVHNQICTFAIRQHNASSKVTSFSEPVNALEYIRTTFTGNEDHPTILLLDLNMPIMDGWQFLEELKNCECNIRAKLDVYILTSSIDERDRQRARLDPTINGFLEKPLSPYQLSTMNLVQRIKHANNDAQAGGNRHFSYEIDDEHRALLEQIAPHFALNEVCNVRNVLRDIRSKMKGMSQNLQVNLLAEQISAFLIANGFAYNLSGDPLINARGMDLKAAGTLNNYIRQERNI